VTWPDGAAQLDGVLSRHAVANRPRNGELHASQVKNGGADPHAICDLTEALVEDRVARDPKYALLLALPAKGEADHIARERAGSRAGRGDTASP
jgi:hypothetical protein